jgi:prepilin-type N-terminal cleavage/methylation domain-containing protein
MQESKKRLRAGNEGFTLIELLIAIVLVGILSAVVIVGVGSLTSKGAASACEATRDAATTAAAADFATNGAYPTTFTAMTSTTPPELDTNGNAALTVAAATIKNGTKWTLTIAGGGATAPTFTCS